MAEFVENRIDLFDQLGECLYLLGQFVQVGIANLLLFAGTKKAHDGLNGVERPPQVEQFALFQKGPFDANPFQRRAYIEKEVGREIVDLLDNVHKLPCAVQLLAYGVVVGRELHSVGIVRSQTAETLLFNERPYLVETYLLLEILRIYHTL